MEFTTHDEDDRMARKIIKAALADRRAALSPKADPDLPTFRIDAARERARINRMLIDIRREEVREYGNRSNVQVMADHDGN